jgi:hypothetical protein
MDSENMDKTIDKISVYKKYIFAEMSKNKRFDIEDLDHLVKSLSSSQAKLVCKFWSEYRKNVVYNFVSKGPNKWNAEVASANNIYVEKVNSSVNDFLRKNDMNLARIVKDKDIDSFNEFKSQGPIDKRLRVFIAKKVGEDKYLIVDGIHRIIGLGREGEKEFRLIYY